MSRFGPGATCRGMDDSTGTAEARIRALGQLRFSEEVHDETEALTLLFEDPAVRSAAAFTSWLARTGEFGDPSTSTEVDDTEWIDLGAPDAPQVVIEAYPDYLTLPKGMPREVAIADVSRIFTKLGLDAGGQGLAQEGLMTQTYETFAICAWTGAWLNAHEASAAAREVAQPRGSATPRTSLRWSPTTAGASPTPSWPSLPQHETVTSRPSRRHSICNPVTSGSGEGSHDA